MSLMLGSGLEYHRRLDERRQEGKELIGPAVDRYRLSAAGCSVGLVVVEFVKEV
jgi:hypothetical protein